MLRDLGPTRGKTIPYVDPCANCRMCASGRAGPSCYRTFTPMAQAGGNTWLLCGEGTNPTHAADESYRRFVRPSDTRRSDTRRSDTPPAPPLQHALRGACDASHDGEVPRRSPSCACARAHARQHREGAFDGIGRTHGWAGRPVLRPKRSSGTTASSPAAAAGASRSRGAHRSELTESWRLSPRARAARPLAPLPTTP